ncbi:MAG: DtxR family transcriptional regulator [Anaerolineales bacterium]|jgi:DtxR family Mn-dependent transcriptional regulator
MYNPLIALLVGLLFLGLGAFLFWPNDGLVGYFQKTRRMSNRILQEDALKHIHKTERYNQSATLESLAGALNISTSKAANLLENMQEGGLVEIKGQSFFLTPQGRDYALQIIRAHRLWERYLSDETGYAESEWHDQADRYEHDLSISETSHLASQLGNPTHDPHGDPIPAADGSMVLHGGASLPGMPLDTALRIVHMEDEPEAVYAQLVAEGLHPGMDIRIIEKTPQRIQFWANGDQHLLAPLVAASISVVEVPREKPADKPVGQPLGILEPGQKGEVLEISPRIRGAERRRMLDLGILPGTVIEAEMNSPSGDPTAYRIRGALIALRDDQANLIRIKHIPETI